MSTPFQNRLVGTIIVAAAAIIFLPDILDGKKQSHQAVFEPIPETPEFNNKVDLKRFPTEKLAQLPVEQVTDDIAQDKLLTQVKAESEKAISSGGLTGKGFMEGTRTIGKFVPEQDTDYIFSTVGEEWGFLGSSLVVVLFVLLLIRILHLAELQKSQFSRIYGYSVASILFLHFLINIGMVMGLIPTIGIPLPFFSYGGSSLWGFTILLFVFIKLDSNRINEW